MKTFNAYKTFFSALAVSGVILLGGLRIVLGADVNTPLLFSHFTVLFLLFVGPTCLLITRLQAVRCGQGFVPKPKARSAVAPSPPVKKKRGKNLLYMNDPLSGTYGTGFVMGFDICDSTGKKRKKNN